MPSLVSADTNQYDRLWQLAKQDVRHSVNRLQNRDISPKDILVVIVEGETTSLAKDLVDFSDSVLVQGNTEKPTVAVLHGDGRRFLLGRWPWAFAYSLAIPADSIMLLASPRGMVPGAAISRVLKRRINSKTAP
jgi:hypothetical protein